MNNPQAEYDIIMGGLDKLEKFIQTASIDKNVELGSILWEVDQRLQALLFQIKETLREQALLQTDGLPGTVHLLGSGVGEAQVKILEDNLQLIKNVDIDNLQKVFGPLFGVLFNVKTTVTLSKEFEEEAVAIKDPQKKKILHQVVERIENSPRVSFRRGLR